MDKTKLIPFKKLPNKLERHKLFGSVQPGPKVKPVEKNKMADLQNIKKDFLFDIDAVGIANVKHPILVNSTLNPTTQTTIGTFQFTSNINKTSKGTNMSRFLEQLHISHKHGLTADFNSFKKFAMELTKRLEQEGATIEVSFPWFYERRGPNSDLPGMNHADVSLRTYYNVDTGYSMSASLSVLVTTLCPCSKEISEYSAHSQRGRVSIEVSLSNNIASENINWREMLLEAAESNASSKIHPVLKRPDEKAVTEEAYENPRFVEDLVRLVAADLYEMPFVTKFKVTCVNEESIHMHDAIASITFDKQNP